MSILAPIEGSGMELYASAPINVSAAVGGSVSGSVKSLSVSAPIELHAAVGGGLSGFGTRATAINIRVSVQLGLTGRVVYDFAEPPPMFVQIPEGWLDGQNYEARLIDSLGVSIPFVSAQVRGDRNRLGEEATILLASQNWDSFTADKRYTLQIGIRPTPTGTIEWHTLIDNGILQRKGLGSAYGTNAPQDSMSIVIGSTWQNRLAEFPRRARIFFDPHETAVDVSSADKIYYEDGTYEEPILSSIPGLKWQDAVRGTLTKKFGFTGGLVTNIPNYPVARVDFPITASYFDVIAGLTGLFDPLFYFEDRTLYIVNKNQATPEDFDPVALIADEYVSVEMESQNPNLEGLVLIYTEKIGEALSSELRTVVTEEQSGDFGTPGSTTTSRTETWKDWLTLDGQVVRSELIREESVTTNHLTVVVGDSTEVHEFDGQGKRVRSTSTVRARMPELTGGVDVLQEVRAEEKTFEYAADPRNPKAIYQRKIINKTSGLIAVDTENEYLGQPFRQSFDRAHEAGNLSDGMGVEYGLIETVTETITPIAHNQFQYRQETVDHIRNTTRNVISEPRSGNPSMGAAGGGGQTRQLLVLAEGITPVTRTGKGVQPFSVGELPLFFALPLCKRVLARLIAGKKNANMLVSGWHPAMKRSLAFNAKSRSGQSYGIFITEGFSVSLENMGTENQRVSTTLEVSEI